MIFHCLKIANLALSIYWANFVKKYQRWSHFIKHWLVFIMVKGEFSIQWELLLLSNFTCKVKYFYSVWLANLLWLRQICPSTVWFLNYASLANPQLLAFDRWCHLVDKVQTIHYSGNIKQYSEWKGSSLGQAVYIQQDTGHFP